jgi:hypothetical protein
MRISVENGDRGTAESRNILCITPQTKGNVQHNTDKMITARTSEDWKTNLITPFGAM